MSILIKDFGGQHLFLFLLNQLRTRVINKIKIFKIDPETTPTWSTLMCQKELNFQYSFAYPTKVMCKIYIVSQGSVMMSTTISFKFFNQLGSKS